MAIVENFPDDRWRSDSTCLLFSNLLDGNLKHESQAQLASYVSEAAPPKSCRHLQYYVWRSISLFI